MRAERSQIVLDAEFNDMGQFANTLGWDLDFRQLEAGPLKARARVMAARAYVGIAVHFNRSFHQLGQAPADQVCFGIPGSRLGDFEWCGADVRGGALINFNLAPGFDSHTLRNFQGHVISFQRERLQQLADANQLDVSLDRLVQSRAAWDSPVSRDLGRWLERIHPVTAPATETDNDDSGSLDEKLGLSVLRILASEDWPAEDKNRTQQSRLLKRSLEILNDHDNLPIGVTELCQAVGTSLSTLNRLFTARFDMTPKAYIRARCLSAVRDELATAPCGEKVVAIANRWGFWHMGQFARDYREMFGELPSATLKKLS